MRTLTRPLIGAGVLALLAATGYAAGDNLGRVLVSEGYAETTTFAHSLANAYSADEDTARDHAAGLWAACR